MSRFLWCCFFLLMFQSSASAISLTGNTSPGSGLTAEELKSDQSWGQTFQIAPSGSITEATIDSVVLYLFRASNQSGRTVTASIRSSWNGAALWESTVPVQDLERDPGANQSSLHDAVTFSGASAAISTDTMYYLRLDTTSSEKVYAHYDQSSSYSPGHLINKDGNSAGSGKDLLFQIEGSYIAVPEPATALLMGLGFAGMARARPRHRRRVRGAL